MNPNLIFTLNLVATPLQAAQAPPGSPAWLRGYGLGLGLGLTLNVNPNQTLTLNPEPEAP